MICIHTPSLLSLYPCHRTRGPRSPPQVITKCWAGLPVLYGNFPLVICFTHDRVHILLLLSQFVLPFPSPSPQVCSLSMSPLCSFHFRVFGIQPPYYKKPKPSRKVARVRTKTLAESQYQVPATRLSHLYIPTEPSLQMTTASADNMKQKTSHAITDLVKLGFVRD